MESRKVLIIDNDPEFIDACRTAINNEYQVLCVSNKEEAQQILNTSFGLIIIGCLSPAGHTFMLQRWIKRHPMYGYIPVLVIDACFYERRWEGLRLFEGLEMEAEEYASKPLEQAELIAIIQKLSKNIISPDRRPIRETCWQAFLALDKEDRNILARRILELRE